MNQYYTRDAKICRFCMNLRNLYYIFSKSDEFDLPYSIHYCKISMIQKNDNLPKYICEECKDNINHFYNFKLRCESVEAKLKSLVNYEYEKNTYCEELNFFDIYEENKNNFQGPLTLQKEISNNICFKKLSETNSSSIETVNGRLNSNLGLQSSEESPNIILERKQNRIQRAVLKENSYQCETCGKVFRTKGVLIKHVFTHQNEKKFSCKLCHKKYNRRDYLTVHLRKHKDVKKYVCESCPKKFYNSQDLIRHKKIHSEERNYSCTRCGKTFKRSADVIPHMRVHTGYRPYVCKECPKAYKSHSGLLKHKKHHIMIPDPVNKIAT